MEQQKEQPVEVRAGAKQLARFGICVVLLILLTR